MSAQPDQWNRPPAGPGWDQTGGWPQSRHAASPANRDFEPPAPAARPLPASPPLSPSVGPPNLPASFRPSEGASGIGQVSPAGPMRRTGSDNWSRPRYTPHQRVDPDDEAPARTRRNLYGDEPAYGPVLGFTAGWYGIPAVLYLIWLATLDGDRRGFVGREFVASLPWLFGAVVLSLTVAALLRWATVGWRTLTLSFAAAVIGAGVATIAHSLIL